MKVTFEWHVSTPDHQGHVLVRERLVGFDSKVNTFGPMPPKIAESFIKARRSFVHRTIKSRTSAIQIFEPHGRTIQ